MPTTKKLWSISGLATELGRDRRTIAKALSNVAPDGKIAGEKAWYLTTAVRTLDRVKRGLQESEEDPFTSLLLSRLENWRAIYSRRGLPPSFTVEEIAALSGVTLADVLNWLRIGMPYTNQGDWDTGEGFRILLAWAIDWQVFITGYTAHVGREDLRDKLGLSL